MGESARDILCYFGYIGIVFSAYIAIRLLYIICKWLYLGCCAGGIDFKDQGRWALITGATDGIGKALAEELAGKGMDILLVSRTQSKLDTVSGEIEEKYKVRVKTLAVDFSAHYSEYSESVKEFVANKEVGLLINNVGTCLEYPEEFLKVPNEKHSQMINTNIVSMNTMINLVMPQMELRKRGTVINIASLGGYMVTPLLSVYAATKAYVINFSRALNAEYRDKGITVMCMSPGYVVSNMSKLKSSNFMQPLPGTYAKSALKYVGVLDESTGYWPHSFLLWFSGIIPQWLQAKLAYKNLLKLRDSHL